jgi:hypothetical protein
MAGAAIVWRTLRPPGGSTRSNCPQRVSSGGRAWASVPWRFAGTSLSAGGNAAQAARTRLNDREAARPQRQAGVRGPQSGRAQGGLAGVRTR